MDDNICCNCGFDIFGVRIEPEACVPLVDINCPCLKLDSTSCSGLPKYIRNTCQAYVWTALGGDLLEGKTSSCKSCIDSTRTIVGKCCRNGRRYSYIKEATWIKDPTSESDCGIKRNCFAFEYLSAIYPDESIGIIDYGYGFDIEKIFSEGGIAGGGPGGPITICPNIEEGIDESFYCACFPNCCNTFCIGQECTQEARCEAMCNPINNCSQFNNVYQSLYNQSFDEYKCQYCSTVENDPCGCNSPPPPEGCDICVKNPCGTGCYVSCSEGPINWCDYFCTTPNEINWSCIFQSAGLPNDATQLLLILRNLGCPCAPDFDTCNDICYNSFGTNDAN
jgi:hypothetical protein